MSSARLTPAQFAAAKALFDSLVDLPPAQQHSALDDASLEPVVRDEVRRLLDHTEADAELLADAQLERAAALRELGEHAAAQTALDGISAQTPAQTTALLAERGRLALARRELAPAGPWIDQAITEAVAADGEDAPATWRLRIEQARWLRQSGRASEARELADRIAERLAPAIAPDGRLAATLRELQG